MLGAVSIKNAYYFYVKMVCKPVKNKKHPIYKFLYTMNKRDYLNCLLIFGSRS